MATIDIIILAMIGVGVIMGLIKGFVKQMASIVGLIAGLLMARALFGIGALKYMILIGLAIHVIEYIDPNNEMISATKKKESVLYYSMRDLSGIFFPVFKNVTEQLIEI